MSQYLDIFVRSDEGKFIRLCDFSRSTQMYSVFVEHGVSYGEVERPDFKAILSDFVESERTITEALSSIKEQIQFIQNCNNPMHEKIEHLHDFINEKQELEATLRELKAAKHYTQFLDEVNFNTPVFVGVECGESPTVAD